MNRRNFEKHEAEHPHLKDWPVEQVRKGLVAMENVRTGSPEKTKARIACENELQIRRHGLRG